nr:hypothetical protein [Tanacetum cinerariifolium]
MVAILKKTEHNTDFYHIVDFLKASHIWYALTIRPTVYVSHVRQLWSTARVEITDRETKILAQVNGRQRTVSESSIRRHLKLNDEEDKTAFPTRDVRYGEAFPTNTSLDAGHDRENIAKTFAMPHEALPRVTSLGSDEGSMQQKLQELMDICTAYKGNILLWRKGFRDTDEEEPAEVEEVLKVVKAAKLMTKVVTTAQPTTTAAQVLKPSAPRRRRGVIIQDPEETTTSVIMHIERYNFIQAFLEKEEEDVAVQEKRQGESLDQETAKIQRIDEDAEELKRHLQIVANDNDVFTEATPLASKVSVVDYQIHHENNKPYYKIIRADRTHKLSLSFVTLLKNFDREDLEALWKLVKERFETIEPNNFSYDFLLNILKIMF